MYDVIIVGCGPAGISAALYLRRNNKTVAIIEKEGIGGQMAKSPLIENYPGFYGSGSELADIMMQPLEMDVDFYWNEVIAIKKCDEGYTVESEECTITGRAIIWATGCSHIQLNVPGEDLDNVHYCVTCDGPLYKGKDVVVIGDGNSALQYALALADYCKNVTIVTLFNQFFGEKRLSDRLINDHHIQWLPNWKTIKFEKQEEDAVAITGEANDTTYTFITDGVFIAIGQKPHNEVIQKYNKSYVDDKGYIITNDLCAINDAGLFAAGDCRQKEYRQIGLACADGITAALEAIKYLNNKKDS